MEIINFPRNIQQLDSLHNQILWPIKKLVLIRKNTVNHEMTTCIAISNLEHKVRLSLTLPKILLQPDTVTMDGLKKNFNPFHPTGP